MATKTPPPKKTTALVPWAAEMAAAAKKGAAAVKMTGGFSSISTSGGVLKVDDVPIPGNRLNCVILVSTPENQWYDRPYNPSAPTPPACYAFGDPDADEPDADMTPHEEASDIQGDADGKCADCEHNKMGSADQGRGKACKNIYRMLLVTEDAVESPEALKAAEVRRLSIPVMSVKNWAAYLKSDLQDMERPNWGVVTTVGLVPDPKSQFRVTFEFAELINFDQALYDAMKAKLKLVTPQLILPYPPIEEAPAAPRGRTANPPARAPVKTVPIVPAKKGVAPAKRAKY